MFKAVLIDSFSMTTNDIQLPEDNEELWNRAYEITEATSLTTLSITPTASLIADDFPPESASDGFSILTQYGQKYIYGKAICIGCKGDKFCSLGLTLSPGNIITFFGSEAD